MNILLIGPPGAGKGTQAAVLESRLSLTHVASGDLFRHHMREGTELGQAAKTYIDGGELVPDELVVDMVLERIAEPDCAGGVIFDGFPRTREQAEVLIRELRRRGGDIDAAVVLTAQRDILLRRLVGRQTCARCGAAYNLFYTPARLEGVCDLCGGELYTRSDDTWDTARHRLDVYKEQTFPLVELFREMGLLHEVDALGEVTEVTERIVKALDGGAGGARRDDVDNRSVT
jgi:adenylate kinase